MEEVYHDMETDTKYTLRREVVGFAFCRLTESCLFHFPVSCVVSKKFRLVDFCKSLAMFKEIRSSNVESIFEQTGVPFKFL